MKRALLLCVVLGCQPPPSTRPSTAAPAPDEPALSTAVPTAASETPIAATSSPALGAPLTGPPRLVVENTTGVGIDLYGGYLVDERGERGTLELWPHRFDCPAYEPKEHIVPNGGTYSMPAPTRSYDTDRCAPGPPLPPGRYILRLHTGYAEDLYAAATVVLPLVAPVRLRIANHAEQPWACDTIKAERAARLAFAAARELPGLPSDFFRGCEVAQARCGTLPLPEDPPPSACTVTLHENLLRVDRPAGNDALRGLTAWTDRAIVYARRPEVPRTSASRVRLGTAHVIVEGITEHHRHEHGGDAASIGHMTVRIHNPLDRPLSYSVQDVEWLVDHSCGLPSEVRRRPAVREASPPKLAPGKTDLTISFAAQSAYQAHCDRFASRARLRLEGQPVVVTVEHQVTRFEPLRR